ncbi:MAG: hypothetical protein JRJ84_02565 [Deltaproteobacteria bacterium]|nr:hypothetical protein [Deltaproteobacteria bacterium]
MAKNLPFKVYIRREPDYELRLTVRFEATDGHGVLSLQRAEKKESAPSLVLEERDVAARELRGGRFIHILAGGRRQSYALSRLTVEVLKRVHDDKWTELEPLTEYGFRYLIVPESALMPGEDQSQAARVAVPDGMSRPPAPVRGATPGAVAARASMGPPRVSDRLSPSGTDFHPADPAGAPSALQRAMSAIRSGRGGSTGEAGPLDDLRQGTPRPAPTARLSGGSVTRVPVPSDAELEVLSREEAILRLKELRTAVAALEKRMADSVARERDLLEVLARWRERELS